MNNITRYNVSTLTYFIIGVLGLMLFFYFIVLESIPLVIITAAIIYVSFDNVTCKLRRDKYLKKR
ncbi:MAG TPA: hypothetical protein VJJ23_05605 [Candidatus Nanoarchaeia archaeon]|nr:hypothetical protein [Candidatus Nanoarchaeia archaeon]